VILIPAITADALLSGFEAIGLNARAFASAAGIVDRDLRALDAVVPAVALAKLWREATRVASREELPTEVGVAIPFGAFGVLDYLVGSAETVEAGLRALCDHFRAVCSGIMLELVPDARGAWLRVVTTAPADQQEIGEEFTVAVTVGRFRARAQTEILIDAVELTRAAPVGQTRHAALLGAPVTFEHTNAGAHFATAALAARLQTADPALRRTLGQIARHLEIGGDDTLDLELAVRSRLRSLLPMGKADAGGVARTLGLSERSFHRRLAELGRSYQSVLDDFRASEGERLLAAGRLKMAQIALSLGYADQTAFSRAFKRWRGMSPSEWLARRKTNPSR
jgi:AraC-like DNA-binding protein